jgi:hypothetical protein
MPAGAAAAGSGVGELASSVRLPPVTANTGDGAGVALVDEQEAAAGAQPGVDCADAGAADRGAAEQRQRAAGGDRVAGDGAGSGVHGEQEPAVMGDLHPARSRLQVGERGSSDRRQRPIGGVAERRDRAGAGAGVVRVGHKQLTGVRGTELAPERAQALGGKGDRGAAVRRPPEPTVKLSTWEVPTRVPASLLPVPLNSTSPGCEPSGSATVEPARARRRPSGLSVKPV